MHQPFAITFIGSLLLGIFGFSVVLTGVVCLPASANEPPASHPPATTPTVTGGVPLKQTIAVTVLGAAGKQLIGELDWPSFINPLQYEHTAHSLLFKSLGQAGFTKESKDRVSVVFIYEENDPVQCRRAGTARYQALQAQQGAEPARREGCLKTFKTTFSPQSDGELDHDRYLSPVLVKQWHWLLPSPVFGRFRWYNVQLPLQQVRAIHIYVPGYTENALSSLMATVLKNGSQATTAAVTGSITGILVN